MEEEFEEIADPDGDEEATWATRDFRSDDAASLIALARSAVLALDEPIVSAAEKSAWLGEIDDSEVFAQRLRDGWVRVACDTGGRSVGFGEISPPGEIGMLYVAPAMWRQGVASCIVDDLVALALAMGAKAVTTTGRGAGASFFQALGFVDIEKSGGKRLQRPLAGKK